MVCQGQSGDNGGDLLGRGSRWQGAGSGERGRGHLGYHTKIFNKHLSQAKPCPRSWQQKEKTRWNTLCFCSSYVLVAKKNGFIICDRVRWSCFKEEALFGEQVTWREWPGNSSWRWWCWYWDQNEDLRRKHSGQDMVLEATANVAFLKSQKAATWLERTEGGRARWNGLAAAAAAFY